MADQEVRSSNFIPALLAQDSLNTRTPVALWADKTTHRLLVDAGTISATLAGTAIPASEATTAVAVQIVDGSGNQIASFGGGTQYTDAGTPPTHPVGNTIEWNNAGAWVTVGSAAPLPISLPSSTITTLTPPTNTGYALDASLTALDASLTTIDTDIKSNITLHAGTALIGKVGIDQTTVGTTNGVALSQINAATTLAGNGATGTGSQRVTIANDNTAIANWGQGLTSAAVPAGAGYTGFKAAVALPTAATAGNLTGALGDKFGRLVVLPNGMRDLISPITQLTLTASTTETSLIGATASVFNDLLSLIVINTSATATQVDFRDSTGGTIRISLYVPAGETRGVVFQTPMPQAAVNTAWTAKCGASVSSVLITGQYISNK